jgi:hypothetical protein
LIHIALKWCNNKKGKDFSKHLQSSTWDTKLKYLFCVFRRKNIQYNHLTDFNGEGEFHSVLSTTWADEMENDPTFASEIGMSTFYEYADKKLREFYKEGKFNPLSTATTKEGYEDRKKYMIYILGRFFLQRGKNEIVFCYWNQVKFKASEVDRERSEYVKVSTKWDKSHKCKLGNTHPRDKTQEMPQVYQNEIDELCPYKFFKFFRQLCLPLQQRILCYGANADLLTEYRRSKLPYLYNENLPVGGNSICPVTKSLAEELGFPDWEKCAGQGLCKMGITNIMSNGNKNIEKVALGMLQHKSLKTSLIYQKPSEEMFQNYNRALMGRHIASPPRKRRGGKMGKEKKG